MVKIDINYEQIRKAVKNLSINERAKMVEELERDTWKERFRQLRRRVDARLKKNPLSQKEIDRVVNQAKKEFHARSSR